MKNFSDLRATDHWLDMEIKTQKGSIHIRWPLLVHLDLACDHPLAVIVDGMPITDFGYDSQGLWRITLHEPFYRWRHRVTGQGWLLAPA